MSSKTPDPAVPSEVDDFAHRLAAFSESLSEKEQTILYAMVTAATPPLDRMASRESKEVLSAEEEALLQQLLARKFSS